MLSKLGGPLLHDILFAAFLCLIGCSEDPEPLRRVQLGGGALDIMISQDWDLERETENGRVYLHRDLEDVRLHFADSTENFGSPLRVPDVKSLIGKELNIEYGGVSSRVSLGGNAMMKYVRLVPDDAGEDLRSEEWVLAKPVGYGDIARVEISLRIPEHVEIDPAIPRLVDSLDRQVGDARIPRV